MNRDDVVAALVAERYGPSLWWKAPEKTLNEEIAQAQRRMLLRATYPQASVDNELVLSGDTATELGELGRGQARCNGSLASNHPSFTNNERG